MIETLKTTFMDSIPQGAEIIGFLFIILVWSRYFWVAFCEDRNDIEIHWFWTWAWTFVMVSIGNYLICLIGGIFIK